MTSLALPEGFTGAAWIHEDAAGISPAAERGVARAVSGDWSSGTIDARVADFRAWLVYRSWLAAGLSGQSGMNAERGAFGIDVDWPAALSLADHNDRARAVALLGKTGTLLAKANGGARFAAWDIAAFQTKAAGAPETGALPLVFVAVVTVIVAVAESAAVAYLAHEAKSVIDNYLARDQASKELVQTDGQVLRVLDSHAAREKEAGAPLPLDDAEKRALDMLDRRQIEAEKRLGTLAVKEETGLPWWTIPVTLAAGIGAAFIFGK